MPLYDSAHRLKTDACNVESVTRENQRLADYHFANRRDCHDSRFRDFAARNPNLIPWDGYGISACMIDRDSDARISPELTQTRCRQQLPNRLFQAVPQLFRGAVLPALESRIRGGADTTCIRECDRIDEKMWNVFHPRVCSSDWQDPRHIIPAGPPGGESSRDITRSDAFLQQIGYRFDGRAWRRACPE